MKIRKKMILSLIGVGIIILLGKGVLADIADDLQLGTRPQAMGGAFVALADDVNAVYWNPAGLKQIEGAQVSFMYANPYGISDVSQHFLSFAHSGYLGRWGVVLGLGWVLQQAELEEGPSGNTNQMRENTYILSLSTSLNHYFFYGVNIKGFTLDAGEEGRKSGMGLDFGSIYKPRDWLSFGLVLRNISAQLGDESFPVDARIGTALRLLEERLVLTMDFDSKEAVNEEEARRWRFHMGGEFKLTPNFSLRAGYDKEDWTAGFGFNFRPTAREIPFELVSFDYAFFKDSDLGEYTHRFSFALIFGE